MNDNVTFNWQAPRLNQQTTSLFTFGGNNSNNASLSTTQKHHIAKILDTEYNKTKQRIFEVIQGLILKINERKGKASGTSLSITGMVVDHMLAYQNNTMLINDTIKRFYGVMWVKTNFDENAVQLGPSKKERLVELQKLANNISDEMKRIHTSMF